MAFQEELSAELAELRELGRFRSLRTIAPLPGGRAEFEGKIYCNLSSNDYMGIACDPDLRKAFYAQYPDIASPELAQSSASSRLLTGNTPAYERLEETLSSLYHHRAALVFNSGYHANIGILPALSGDGDLILSDKLNHASIIDGMRLADAEFKRYRHLDMEQLETMLKSLRPKYRRVFLVTESVFSMDGDAADLAKLVELKKKYDAVLVVDEAHAVGVRGPAGTGLAAETGVADDVDVLIGTFGKAFGSTGAYAVMSPEMRSYLVNKMRPLIFTTGLPPVILNWSRFVLERCVAMDGRREKLRRMGNRLRELFRNAGLVTGGESQIVPLVVGEDRPALETAEKFQKNGFLVFAIRPPTVPQGTCRLRFSLSAALEESDIEAMGKIL
ncbi:MAG: 8-amino-7-oxononanoate synthase 2 [Lentisphaerae bacterium ADurb.Bin242]|nr:MAG: 8-amino-7-oxononanoate synthase 2 [Lentisphaerae bacterium ADurb.Bin242]